MEADFVCTTYRQTDRSIVTVRYVYYNTKTAELHGGHFDEYQRAVGMLNPMRDKKKTDVCTGGEKRRHL